MTMTLAAPHALAVAVEDVDLCLVHRDIKSDILSHGCSFARLTRAVLVHHCRGGHWRQGAAVPISSVRSGPVVSSVPIASPISTARNGGQGRPEGPPRQRHGLARREHGATIAQIGPLP